MSTNSFSIATLSKSSSEIRQENETFLREEQERFESLYEYKFENGKMKQLGKGGNGAVFEAVYIQSNVDVAIKIVPRPDRYNDLSQEILSNCADIEYQFLKKLKKVNGVIKLYAFFQLESVNLYVMEKPVCKDLTGHIYDINMDKQRPLSDFDTKKLFKQAVKIAIGCQEEEVFHCDIKPSNYLVDLNDKLYLIDFGNSHKSKKEGYNSKKQKATPQYMPPEAHFDTIYHEEPTTVWSLGCVLFEMLCSKLLFTGNILGNFETEIYCAELLVPTLISHLTPEAQDLILQCLKLNPKDRITLKKVLTHPWTLGITLKTQSQKRSFSNISREEIELRFDGKSMQLHRKNGSDLKKQKMGSESCYDTTSTPTGYAKDPSSRPVILGGAMALPVFGRPVNHISTRGADYAHQITTGTSGFSDFPTALPSHQQEYSQPPSTYHHTPANIQGLQAILAQKAYQQAVFAQQYQQAYLQALQASGYYQAPIAFAPAPSSMDFRSNI